MSNCEDERPFWHLCSFQFKTHAKDKSLQYELYTLVFIYLDIFFMLILTKFNTTLSAPKVIHNRKIYFVFNPDFVI